MKSSADARIIIEERRVLIPEGVTELPETALWRKYEIPELRLPRSLRRIQTRTLLRWFGGRVPFSLTAPCVFDRRDCEFYRHELTALTLLPGEGPFAAVPSVSELYVLFPFFRRYPWRLAQMWAHGSLRVPPPLSEALPREFAENPLKFLRQAAAERDAVTLGAILPLCGADLGFSAAQKLLSLCAGDAACTAALLAFTHRVYPGGETPRLTDRRERTLAEWREKYDFLADPQSGTAILRGVYEPQKTTALPEKLGDLTVTALGGFCFYTDRVAETVELPDSVTEIGPCAFAGAWPGKIRLPTALKTLGAGAFQKSFCMIGFEIPDGVTEIPDDCFGGCEYVTAFRLPARLRRIGDRAFYSCRSVDAFDLPQTLEELGEETFAGCRKLTEIRLPDRIRRIPERCFARCTALAAAEFPAGLAAIGEEAFYRAALTQFRAPDALTEIGKSAFCSCEALRSAVLPDGLTELPENCFNSCTALASVRLPAGLKTLGKGAFYNCGALETILLPAGVTRIGYAAFSLCTSLKDLRLPDGLLTLDERAFDGCRALERIALPDGLRTIGARAFQCCAALEEIRIPASVTEIGKDAFAGCPKLTVRAPENSAAHAYAIANGLPVRP